MLACFQTRPKLNINIALADKPVWHDGSDQTPPSVEATEGQNVLLKVSAHGKPSSITFTWRKDGEVVGSGSKLLALDSVSRTQAGLYQVEATNTEGSAFKNISLVVKCEWQVALKVCNLGTCTLSKLKLVIYLYYF